MDDVPGNRGHRITVREVAERLGVTSNTVINLCKAGRGPRHVRIPPASDAGRSTWLFYEADVESWIAKHVVEEACS